MQVAACSATPVTARARCSKLFGLPGGTMVLKLSRTSSLALEDREKYFPPELQLILPNSLRHLPDLLKSDIFSFCQRLFFLPPLFDDIYCSSFDHQINFPREFSFKSMLSTLVTFKLWPLRLHCPPLGNPNLRGQPMTLVIASTIENWPLSKLASSKWWSDSAQLLY